VVAHCSCFDLVSKTVNKTMLSKAHYMLRPFMLRRLKADVEKGLPPRIETKIMCPLSEMQIFWYKRLLLKESDAMQRYESGKGQGADWKRLQALLVQVRAFARPGAPRCRCG
jgi:SWI/SNF-related matrix-associated actin-dependent regulator of chromatin subfamily A member 5